MRIISSFYDYYDPLTSQFDSDLVYVRETKESTLDKQICRQIFRDYPSVTMFVKICDHLYHQLDGQFWDVDDFKQWLLTKFPRRQEMINKEFDRNSLWSGYNYTLTYKIPSRTEIQTLENNGQLILGALSTLSPNSPIVALQSDGTLLENPRLNSLYGFVNKRPVPIALCQELYMWLGKQAAPDVAPEMPNNIKIEQHGFDLKKSFRHRSKNAQ